jgi:imidazolonepropionase-like amidohydrolase
VEAHESNDQDPLRDLKARLLAMEMRSKERADCAHLIEKIAKAGETTWGHDSEFQAQKAKLLAQYGPPFANEWTSDESARGRA